MCSMYTVIKCNDCNDDDSTRNVNGKMTCIRCGLISNHSVFVPDLFYLMKKNKRTKSAHRRHRWFQKRIRGIVPSLMIDALTDDFIKVVNVRIDNGLIRKNVSRYNYYIIRLCSKRDVKLKSKINDMKEGKTRERFDNSLFGIVYKCLGWTDVAERNCKYYEDWLER